MTAAAPLAGRHVVITQAAHQAPELAALLEECGATALLYPCIAVEPPHDSTELDGALAAVAAGHYDWLVLTSANTVRVLDQRVRALNLPPSMWSGVNIAAIGPATGEAAAHTFGRGADLVPEDNVAEGLARALQNAVPRGRRLLLPQADIARPVLARSLTAAGVDVVPVVAYHTTLGSGGVDLPALLAARPAAVDAITLTSSSTVRNLLKRLQSEGGDPSLLEDICLAAIGPVTAETLHAAGLTPSLVAQNQSLKGLVQALIDYWRRQ
jgi:uroporphyrinogen-III synthase